MRIIGVGVIAGILAGIGGAWASPVDDDGASPTDVPDFSSWDPEESAKGPIQLVVSVPGQRVDIYVDGNLIATSPVSTGKKGNETPTGVFSILQKRRHHRSNIYSRAPMPFMQRLTWSGIALHASNDVPDYPASHGCVRLPPAFAKKLFKYTSVGAHVVISDGTAGLNRMSHPNLIQPALPQRLASLSGEAEALATGELATVPLETNAVERSTSPVRILVTRRTGRERVRDVQRLLRSLGFDPGKLDGWMGRNTGSAIARFQDSQGLKKTGSMSDELVEEVYRAAGLGPPPTGHIYVRQDFNPVFDAPIAIAIPEKRLGTHLFTVMQFDEMAREAHWLATELGHDREDALASGSDKPNVVPAGMPVTAGMALDRIQIPASVRWRISEMLTPGSSMVITDGGISSETTAKGSDFVVLTR